MRGFYTPRRLLEIDTRHQLLFLCDIDVIKLENSAQDGGSTTIYDSCQKVEWDTFIKQRLFATLKGSVHSVDLRWLPILEAAVAREEGLKLDSISDDLPLPEVKRVLSGSCSATDSLLGAISLGDPLEAGLILAIHSSQGVLALTPEDVSTATMDVSKSPLETVPKKMNDTSNVTGEALKKLAKGPEATFNAADTINKYSSAAFDTNTKFSGTDEDANSEIMTVLSKSFADLKLTTSALVIERTMKYAPPARDWGEKLLDKSKKLQPWQKCQTR